MNCRNLYLFDFFDPQLGVILNHLQGFSGRSSRLVHGRRDQLTQVVLVTRGQFYNVVQTLMCTTQRVDKGRE